MNNCGCPSKRLTSTTCTHTHYITSHLADAFTQSDLQLITGDISPWSNVGLRALLKGPTAVQILPWTHQGLNHRPCGSNWRTLTTTLHYAVCLYFSEKRKTTEKSLKMTNHLRNQFSFYSDLSPQPISPEGKCLKPNLAKNQKAQHSMKNSMQMHSMDREWVGEHWWCHWLSNTWIPGARFQIASTVLCEVTVETTPQSHNTQCLFYSLPWWSNGESFS